MIIERVCDVGNIGVLADTLLAIEHASFPKQLNNKADYIELLENSDNINLLLKKEEIVCGYLCARPHNDAVAELRIHDPDLQFDDGRYYVDMMEILPEYRHRGDALDFLLFLTHELSQGHELGDEIKVSMHIRSSYGFGETILRIFPTAACLRRVDNWMGTGESYDYIEINGIIGSGTWKMIMKKLGNKES